jgi:tetratricopeptide (TPR) repeat protein
LAERRRAQADSALAVADSARAVAQRQQGIATAAAERATREVAKAGAINEFLQTMLASSDPANARGKELTVREVLDQAATATKRQDLEQQPEVRAAVLSTIGRAYYGLGLFDQARPHLDSAYAIRRRTAGAASLPVAESADELGKLASATGDYSQAEQMAMEALAVGRHQLAPNDDRVTAAIAALADVRYRQGRFAAAESLYRQSLSLARSKHGSAGGPVVADRLRVLGTFLSYTDRGGKALPLLQEAVTILRRTFGPNHPKVLDGLIGLADAYDFVPDYAAAERTLREALPIAHAIYGAEHPLVADVLSRLGTSLTSQQRLEESEPFHRSALAMRLKLLGDQHPDVQLARVELARLLQEERRFAETDTLLTLALAARRATLGESNPAVASTMTDLGLLAKSREDWPSAETWFRKAAPIWRDAKIEDQEITSLAELGFALGRQDRLDEAETILSDVLARRTRLFGEKDWSVGDTYEKLTPIAFGKHQPERAESLATKALEIRRAVYGAKSPQAGRQLQNIAFVREARGDTAGAVSYLRESVALIRARRPASDAGVLDAERMLSIDLCATGAVAEGDSLIRAAIRLAPADSTDYIPARLRTALGICLTEARRFPEAEPVLLEAERQLRALAGGSRSPSHKLAVTWLASLYEQWGKAEKAAEWRNK